MTYSKFLPRAIIAVGFLGGCDLQLVNGEDMSMEAMPDLSAADATIVPLPDLAGCTPLCTGDKPICMGNVCMPCGSDSDCLSVGSKPSGCVTQAIVDSVQSIATTGQSAMASVVTNQLKRGSCIPKADPASLAGMLGAAGDAAILLSPGTYATPLSVAGRKILVGDGRKSSDYTGNNIKLGSTISIPAKASLLIAYSNIRSTLVGASAIQCQGDFVGLSELYLDVPSGAGVDATQDCAYVWVNNSKLASNVSTEMAGSLLRIGISGSVMTNYRLVNNAFLNVFRSVGSPPAVQLGLLASPSGVVAFNTFRYNQTPISCRSQKITNNVVTPFNALSTCDISDNSNITSLDPRTDFLNGASTSPIDPVINKLGKYATLRGQALPLSPPVATDYFGNPRTPPDHGFSQAQ